LNGYDKEVVLQSMHGRNEVSLAPPCSNLRSFGSKCALEESTSDIVVTFWQ